MPNEFVDQHRPVQISHYLMNLDQDLLRIFQVECYWFYVRVNLAPLRCPIFTYRLMAFHKTSLESSGPLNIRVHIPER